MTYRQRASQFVQLSPESTNPLLSNATRFPYFVRDVPPDTFQGVALASLMDRFVTQYIQRGLMSATTKSFALVHADDAYSAGIAGVFLAALPATQVRVGVEVTIAMAVYSALPPAQKATWLTQLLRAVCDSADYVVVALLPQSYTQAVLAAGQQACNMTGSRWVAAANPAAAATVAAPAAVDFACIFPTRPASLWNRDGFVFMRSGTSGLPVTHLWRPRPLKAYPERCVRRRPPPTRRLPGR